MKQQHLPSPCPLPEGEGSKPFSLRDKGTLEAEQKGWDEGGF
jgi:hypothetical protein